MAKKVIKNFLIGIGIETKGYIQAQRKVKDSLEQIKAQAKRAKTEVSKTGEEIVESVDRATYRKRAKEHLTTMQQALKNIRSLAFGTGVALAGMGTAFAFNTDRIKNNAELERFSKVYATLPDNARALGQALAQQGGSEEGLLSQLATLEKIRALHPSELAGVFSASGMRGVDARIVLDAESAVEAYLNLADVMKDLSLLERINLAPVFGLDDNSIRLLSKGRAELEAMIEANLKIRDTTNSVTKESEKLSVEWGRARYSVLGMLDAVLATAAPVATGALKVFNNLAEAGASSARRAANAAKWVETGNLIEPLIKINLPKDTLQSTNYKSAVSLDMPRISLNSFEAGKEATPPPKQEPLQTEVIRDINVNLNLDGQVIDQKVIRVMEEQFDQAREQLVTGAE